eukprot:GFUD01029878.1.p1 GENE.GFUD01029878.1~~GFUD01029878.1.p1  ORF type:complete len:558 (-),score=157.37 GFUD01029878.1:326-1999(-)
MSSGSSSPGSRSISPQPVRHEVLLGASVPNNPFQHSPFHPSPIPFPDIHEMATLASGGRNNPHNFSRHFPLHRIPHSPPRPNNKHHNAPDWQTTRCKVAERGKHLLDSGIWSDCDFIVGLPPNIKIFHCHKMFLAMASPVFEAMFYGGLAETKREIKILDVQPEAFSAMLSYVYTDEVHLTSFELVCDICYAAKKYMLPDLVEECTKYLWRDLYPRNACRALEFAKLFEEPVLLEKALQIITHQTMDVIEENTWEDIERTTLVVILNKDSLAAPEAIMFDAMDRWAGKECERRGMNSTGDTKRIVLGDALYLIRYLSLSAAEFAAGPAQSGILLQQESFSILMNISCPGSWELPDHMAKIAEARRDPGRVVEVLQDCGSKHWCKRAMMQEPHCLNTSILDCSVTFTVDKDVWIHGIEVPSQVTDVPEQLTLESLQPPVEGLPIICHSSHGYNELLYAHLLDGEGQRLTYTHFTAKVNWNSMIEITFNRSVKINANKVYRIGMVLNKVGWYPMGVCTRRVNCEGSFFTFCVGQPNDTLRDGLIRSIIFSRIDSLWSSC